MDEDYLIEPWQRTPPGGQYAGVQSGVKITHLPSGLVACVNTERSQHRNKAIAMDMILGGLTGGNYR